MGILHRELPCSTSIGLLHYPDQIFMRCPLEEMVISNQFPTEEYARLTATLPVVPPIKSTKNKRVFLFFLDLTGALHQTMPKEIITSTKNSVSFLEEETKIEPELGFGFYKHKLKHYKTNRDECLALSTPLVNGRKKL
jgi:hypothetical protein